MIVADTSALFAAMFAEPAGPACIEILLAASQVAISAGTLIELGIVTARPSRRDVWLAFKQEFDFDVHDVTASFAEAASQNYLKWGKGIHSAQLNMGDIYAYTLARQLNAPLLYVGKDFAQTDVKPALDPTH